jgi:hypothetical protein
MCAGKALHMVFTEYEWNKKLDIKGGSIRILIRNLMTTMEVNLGMDKIYKFCGTIDLEARKERYSSSYMIFLTII